MGLLVGLFAFTAGAPPSGAAPAAPAASCPDGSGAEPVALPSGATTDVCTAPATTSAAGSSISLAKTVGTDAATCAAADRATVTVGTTVFYCYTVTNTGSVTVSVHSLQDDKVGSILQDYPYVLGPGATTYVTASASLASSTVNVATWSAFDGTQTVTATDNASVDVISAVAPGAPTITSATVSEGQVIITWDPPASDGGQPILTYKITPIVEGTPGSPTTVSGSVDTVTMDLLQNGATYTFDVQATNVIGPGPADTTDPLTPLWWLPWSSGPTAVDELFTWFTGKPPTAAEKTAWLTKLDAGTDLPGDLVAELRAGTDATTNVDPTVRLYSAYLTRIPDASGLNFWLGRRRAGWTLSRISANFAASSEFKRRYGTLTNRQFVEQIYLNVLGRPGEKTGVDYWTKQLDTKKKSRGQVMINFSESSEYRNKQVDNVNAAVIWIYLRGRSPSTVERDAMAAELDGGATVADVVRDQIHVPAFADRAG
ncbi:MAG: DUF4214 domain-containing protein [Acidimicrobiales bacterium]